MPPDDPIPALRAALDALLPTEPSRGELVLRRAIQTLIGDWVHRVVGSKKDPHAWALVRAELHAAMAADWRRR